MKNKKISVGFRMDKKIKSDAQTAAQQIGLSLTSVVEKLLEDFARRPVLVFSIKKAVPKLKKKNRTRISRPHRRSVLA